MKDERKQIDVIDQTIMALLDKRFALTKAIGIMKQASHLPIENRDREADILAKANGYTYATEIKAVYHQLFTFSKYYQSLQYGLIGRQLSYTLSPLIYQTFGLDDYRVVETNHFEKTMEKLGNVCVNVTNPYKGNAYRWCKQKDVSAEATQCVNTIIGNKGYNTDYLALCDLFKQIPLDFLQAKIVIIGNGDTSRSINCAIGGHARFLVREVRGKNEYLITDYLRLADCDVLINATPYGIKEAKPLFHLDAFHHLKLVMDVVYHPIITPLIKEAKIKKIPIIYGLDMLISQAKLAYTLMTGNAMHDEAIKKDSIKEKIANIVLIGMPFSGKSTLGKLIAHHMGKPLIDSDKILEKDNNDLQSILKRGLCEADFRCLETNMAIHDGKKINQVIATGGGIIHSEKAMQALKSNGIIVFLDTSLETLIVRMDETSRPLVRSKDDLTSLYHLRRGQYKQASDIIITEDKTIEEILEEIYAYIHHQWA